jgi:hypothetical protein
MNGVQAKFQNGKTPRKSRRAHEKSDPPFARDRSTEAGPADIQAQRRGHPAAFMGGFVLDPGALTDLTEFWSIVVKRWILEKVSIRIRCYHGASPR